MITEVSPKKLISVRLIIWANYSWVKCFLCHQVIKRTWVHFTMFVNDLIDFLYFSNRNCFNYDSHCSRLWTLHSSGPCKSDWLLLVLAGYHIHLALFIGLDRSTSFGLEQIHIGNSWIRLLSGLEVKRPQWHLLCALFFSRLSGCTCCDHGLLLWTYSICSKNGKLMEIRLLLIKYFQLCIVPAFLKLGSEPESALSLPVQTSGP